MGADRRVFLGWVDPNLPGLDKNPLVYQLEGSPAAGWQYGDTGAPHMRIAGSTGGAKSSLVRMIGRGLTWAPGVEHRAMTFIDAEGAGEFTILEGMPGVARVLNVDPLGNPDSVQDAADIIAGTLAISQERAGNRLEATQAWRRYLNAAGQQPGYRPPGEVWLFIDGWGTLRQTLARYLPKAKLDPVEDAALIGKNGRKTDVHLVIADQTMYASRGKDDDGMPSKLKKQLNCSVAAVGKLGLTATEAMMAFDDAGAGDRIPAVPGGAMMKVGATMLPFVTPYWLNAADPDSPATVEQRREAYGMLPPPVGDAA